MATMTGKAARKTGGNRYACKRSNRRRNPAKVARWQSRQKEWLKGSSLSAAQQKTKDKYGL